MPELPAPSQQNLPPETTHVPHESQSFEEIKNAVYERAAALWKAQKPFSKIRFGKDLYEILNRRLVFRTPAHKELPHFITPFGSLRVLAVHEGEIENDAFVIE
jgi:hypothetical protein